MSASEDRPRHHRQPPPADPPDEQRALTPPAHRTMTPARPLGIVERLFEWMNQEGASTHVVIAHLDHRPAPDHLRAALTHVQARHPTLAAHIAQDDEGVWRFWTAATPPPVAFEVLDERDALQHAEHWVNTPFDAAAGPLWRVALCPDDDAWALVMAFHHALEDGRSSLHFVEGVLDACHRLRDGQPLPTPTPRPLLPPVETLVSSQLGWRVKLRAIMRGGFRAFFPPAMIMAQPDAPFSERRTRLQRRALDSDTTQALIAAARRQETTVQGALSAAMLRAASRRAPKGLPARMTCDANIDLRPLCSPPVPDDAVAMLIGSLSWMFKLQPDPPFWELAREVRRRIAQMIAEEDPRHNMKLIEWIGFKQAWMRQGIQEGHGRQQTVFVSNLGRAVAPQGLRHLSYATAQHGMGACFWLGAVTLRGSLGLTFAHVTPLVTDDDAADFADEVIAELRRVAT